MIGFLFFELKKMLKGLYSRFLIYNYNRENSVSINQSVVISGPLDNLIVGKNTTVNSGCCFRNKQGKINIGTGCLLARNVTILTSQYDMTSPSLGDSSVINDVEIGNNVWIGTNVVIMPGVKIATGAVIGAQSVVTKDVPSNSINAGIPSKVLSYRKINDRESHSNY